MEINDETSGDVAPWKYHLKLLMNDELDLQQKNIELCLKDETRSFLSLSLWHFLEVRNFLKARR